MIFKGSSSIKDSISKQKKRALNKYDKVLGEAGGSKGSLEVRNNKKVQINFKNVFRLWQTEVMSKSGGQNCVDSAAEKGWYFYIWSTSSQTANTSLFVIFSIITPLFKKCNSQFENWKNLIRTCSFVSFLLKLYNQVYLNFFYGIVLWFYRLNTQIDVKPVK